MDIRLLERDVAVRSESEIDTDRLFEILSDDRRRLVLGCLDAHPRPLALADLAEEVAVRERDTEITEIPADDVKEIYISLYHVHVPKMADAGILDYSQERDLVALSESSDEIFTE